MPVDTNISVFAYVYIYTGFPGGSEVKNLLAMQATVHRVTKSQTGLSN